jgi:hypothetical protein
MGPISAGVRQPPFVTSLSIGHRAPPRARNITIPHEVIERETTLGTGVEAAGSAG